ncbi:uncharacterized protein TRUGW13939_01036 [Talaromyces rugulosus]|uniref:Uncharacterized protein n=1 Tax=Talaromyces rugulosus TaxID=121627 RepID=A0A7H8QJ88_TALRU|nr:uncharacterized protein TRUGW13939_01036 [Talaromyces rugulosus]QKX53956.1 hypothetical protein TRUGW13939_01036 [Talaromyces rugulosus]
MALLLHSDINALHKASKAKLIHMKIQRERRESEKNYEYDFSGLQYPGETDGSGLPLIPSPSLFSSLHSTTADSPWLVEHGIPTVAHCATHLELLEVFFALRNKIINSEQLDNTFGVKVVAKIVYRRKYDSTTKGYVSRRTTLRDDSIKFRRREKWSYYLSIAVERFKFWIEKADKAMFEEWRSSSKKPALPCLPPLDVLMVWHAFLLNPIDFDSYCGDHSLYAIRQIQFPWVQIHNSIDTDEWTYEVPLGANDWTTKVANMEPDLFVYLQQTGAIPKSISRTLRKYGDSNVPIGSMWDYLRGFGLSRREEIFLDLLLNIQMKDKTSERLIGNVLRQASFVDKMHDHLWICSPAAEGTLYRAIARYHKFLKLFQLYPGNILVPTLDIDLVWHTHQCSAAFYENSMRERTGRYIDHDDKIGKTALDSGIDETQKLFRLRFGQEYSLCLCWDCEMTLTMLEKLEKNSALFQTDSIGSIVEHG